MDNVEIDEQIEQVLKAEIANIHDNIDELRNRKNKVIEDYNMCIEFLEQMAERKSRELFEMYGAKQEQEREQG